MALDIRVFGNISEVYGTKTGKVFFQGSIIECAKEIKRIRRNWTRKASRKALNEAMGSLGLVKVRGALGGTYWE